VFAGLLLSAGSLGDRLGARRVFDAGLILFSLASAACALAPSVIALVIARLIQRSSPRLQSGGWAWTMRHHGSR
jgi:DHA2 family methylenomycin A resistance protein-like MFS transporter